MARGTELDLDIVLFAGDPDDGAQAHPSARVLEEFDRFEGSLGFDDVVYGAITFTKEGKEIGPRIADPIIRLMTNVVRTVPYVMEGEPETAVMSESLHGYIFQRANNEVLMSFFRGEDAFEPEELLIDQELMDAGLWADQVCEMAERLVEICKRARPDTYEDEDVAGYLIELLSVAKDAAKTFRLEREHGLR